MVLYVSSLIVWNCILDLENKFYFQRFTIVDTDSQINKSRIYKAVSDFALEEANRALHGHPYHHGEAHSILKAYQNSTIHKSTVRFTILKKQ